MTTDFGQRLKEARKNAKLTQVQLAKKAGIGQSTLAELEKSGFGSARVASLASACGVSVHWLATGDGPMRAHDAPSHESIAAAQPTLAQALEVVACALSHADELTRIQARPLLQRLLEQPGQVGDIAQRLLPLLGEQRLSTETQDFAPQPHTQSHP